MHQDSIRNFCIIAHIDHGKSTLADRLLELTGTIDSRQMKDQILDRMDLERERGITIKLAPVRMSYEGFELNLIDTPGHVDFSYEVSRSLVACEGAILIVDATQGIQAQTLANVYLALDADLKIIPVMNKIDLPAADTDRVGDEIVGLLGCAKEDILLVSAKTGEGVKAVLGHVINDIPPPHGETDQPTRALVFDSYYDDYRGVILYVRVTDGSIQKNAELKVMSNGSHSIALETGALTPNPFPTPKISSGEIGYIVTNLKSSREAQVGDTITLDINPATQPLPGYQPVKAFVYAGFFPDSNENYQALKDAIYKLSLSDAALQFSPENSSVLGHGFRIGFLGLLHMDIVRERLEREYDLELIITNPSTDYKVQLTNGSKLTIQSASELPDASQIAIIEEPWIKGEIVCPKDYTGPIIQLLAQNRGLHKNLSYVDKKLMVVSFEAPLANLLTNFYDQLKSITSGYGSFNYELNGYREADLVRLDFYVAGERIEALSLITHRNSAVALGRDIVKKLKLTIPRQNFEVSIQAGIGGTIIARDDLSAYRKDVTGYLYGGDVSRKKKLLAKQKKGKQRMKHFGKIALPAEAFSVMLQRETS